MNNQNPLRYGVLGVAGIAMRKVIPGMRDCVRSKVTAIASRDREKAEAAAEELGLEKAYGSYEDLLADPEIDVIYNPLPNHLHVPWSVKAAEAGKHVLCEKPIAMSSVECRDLIAVRDRTGVKIGEAFMVVTHPQWLRAKEIVGSGRIGKLRSITGFFSYFNVDPANIRNRPEYGGGSAMDIGCYPIMMSRWIFGEEPVRVRSSVECDPEFQTDRLVSAVLEFPSGQCAFTCSTQLVPYQRMILFGTKGRVELEVPFNAPPGETSRILIDDGSAFAGASAVVEEFAACDQYALQADAFSKAVQEGTPVPVPLEESVKNMLVIEAVLGAKPAANY